MIRRFSNGNALGRIVLIGSIGTVMSLVPIAAQSMVQQDIAESHSLIWPVPDLIDNIENVLSGYYAQQATAGTPVWMLAPLEVTDLAPSVKDPDTLWEVLADYVSEDSGQGSTSCHGAQRHTDFVDCTGARLARSLAIPYSGGHTLFRAERGYYANDAIVRSAGQAALYHAYVLDFDPTVTDRPSGVPLDSPRQEVRYHQAMIRAYESHMRDVLVHMFRDTRHDAGFQLSFTRSAGWLATPYIWTIQALEEHEAWRSREDRHNAIQLVEGLNQRIFWEWIVPQPFGPRTAGLADIGSQHEFDAALGRHAAEVGQDHFVIYEQAISSLRPAEQDRGSTRGFWFDADYTVPGEWWCRSFDEHSTGYERCMDAARDQSLGGSMSPFGQYYGDGNCQTRSAVPTSRSCGESNLGSIAEEWLGTHVGGRAGLQLSAWLTEANDPDAPSAALGPAHHAYVRDRVGFGAAGWHGGEGRQDDMEWSWNLSAGQAQSIRTLSAGRFDTESQNGRHSLGELDTSDASTATRGDTWAAGGAEAPGAMENHSPGPNPLYGSVIFNQILSDKVSGTMSPSLYDANFRNHPDEFLSWVWLLIATYYHCSEASDPGGDSCFAFGPDTWPYPPEIEREPLFFSPSDSSVPLAVRHLWRESGNARSLKRVAEAAGTFSSCRGQPGLPWARPWITQGESGETLLVEGGFGAYNLLLQGGGGFMRLAAARARELPPSPDFELDYRRHLEEVLQPWYHEMKDTIGAILDLYSDSRTGYGYIPDVEHARCLSEQGDALTWRAATGDTVPATIVHRANWYAAAASWYWWYDSTWLDLDDRWAGRMVPTSTANPTATAEHTRPSVTTAPTQEPPTPTREPSVTSIPTATPVPSPAPSAAPTSTEANPSPSPSSTLPRPDTATPSPLRTMTVTPTSTPVSTTVSTTPTTTGILCTDIITNGSFENGFEVWDYSDEAKLRFIARTGNMAAMLLGRNGTNGSLSQSFTIPESTRVLILSYWWRVESSESDRAQRLEDWLRIQLDSISRENWLIEAIDQAAPRDQWMPSAYTWSDNLIHDTIVFHASSNRRDASSFYIDDVQLIACDNRLPALPTMTVLPDVVRSGESFQVNATGFASREPVVAWLNEPTTKLRFDVRQGEAAEDGSFQFMEAMPSSQVGEWHVGIRGTDMYSVAGGTVEVSMEDSGALGP